MTTLVTGASGHLGANLVRRLTDAGDEVRVLLRLGSNNRAMDGLEVERVHGDLRDPAALRPAVAGCERVFHCAAMLSTIAGNEREIYDCNVVGTRNLLAASRAAGVRRVVVTGSLSAVGFEPGRPSDESMGFYPFAEHLPYAHTKALVEHESWKAVAEGVDIVVATSTAILGPNDHKPSRMGKLLLDYANGRLRAYIPGGFEFVAASDLCEGHLLAMQHGRCGQKYIFSTSFLSVDELIDLYEEVTGMPRPPLRLPEGLMAAIAGATETLHLIPPSRRRLTPAAVRFLRSRRQANCTKAKEELGYRPTSLRPAIEAAYEDFCRRGLVGTARRRRARGARPRSAPGAATAAVADTAEPVTAGAGPGLAGEK